MEPKAAAIVRPHQTLQKKEEDLIYTLTTYIRLHRATREVNMRKRAKLLLKKQNNDEKPTLASSFKQSIQQKGKRKNKKKERGPKS